MSLDELLQNEAECERLRLHFKTTVAGMGVPSRVSGVIERGLLRGWADWDSFRDPHSSLLFGGLSAGSSDAEPVLSHPSRTRSGGTGGTAASGRSITGAWGGDGGGPAWPAVAVSGTDHRCGQDRRYRLTTPHCRVRPARWRCRGRHRRGFRRRAEQAAAPHRVAPQRSVRRV